MSESLFLVQFSCSKLVRLILGLMLLPRRSLAFKMNILVLVLFHLQPLYFKLSVFYGFSFNFRSKQDSHILQQNIAIGKEFVVWYSSVTAIIFIRQYLKPQYSSTMWNWMRRHQLVTQLLRHHYSYNIVYIFGIISVFMCRCSWSL
jgi:hypothetical protein